MACATRVPDTKSVNPIVYNKCKDGLLIPAVYCLIISFEKATQANVDPVKCYIKTGAEFISSNLYISVCIGVGKSSICWIVSRQNITIFNPIVDASRQKYFYGSICILHTQFQRNLLKTFHLLLIFWFCHHFVISSGWALFGYALTKGTQGSLLCLDFTESRMM